MKPAKPSEKGTTRRSFLAHLSLTGIGFAMAPFLPQASAAERPGDIIRSGTAIFIDPVATNLTINGKKHSLNLDPRTTLLDLLREQLGLTGSKKGCDHGQCGACTVLLNDTRVNACLILASSCDGEKVTTVEGLAQGSELHPMQKAFIRHDAFQCGYCTPGQICSAIGLLHEGHAKTHDDIKELMSGNICRCGAYQNIAAAVMEVQQTS